MWINEKSFSGFYSSWPVLLAMVKPTVQMLFIVYQAKWDTLLSGLVADHFSRLLKIIHGQFKLIWEL